MTFGFVQWQTSEALFARKLIFLYFTLNPLCFLKKVWNSLRKTLGKTCKKYATILSALFWYINDMKLILVERTSYKTLLICWSKY